MSGAFVRVNEATELAIGRNPNPQYLLTRADNRNPPGVTGNLGIALEDTVSCDVVVTPTLFAGYITALAAIDPGTYDTGTTYTLTVDGTGYSSTGASNTVEETAEEIRDLINATAAAPEDSTATIIDFDGDGIKETIVVRNKGDYEADPVVDPSLTVDFSVSGGSGSWREVSIDAEIVSIKVWGLLKSRLGVAIPIPWVVPQEGGPWPREISADGDMFRLNVPMCERVYVQEVAITERAGSGVDVTPHYFLAVAPAIPEEDDSVTAET